MKNKNKFMMAMPAFSNSWSGRLTRIFPTLTEADRGSADCQSAVSRVSNPQDAELFSASCRLEAGDTAGWKPALRVCAALVRLRICGTSELKLAVLALLGAATLVSGCASAPRAGHATADWYYPAWMAEVPYAPTFQVLDTESSLGPYARQTKTITLQDLVKMHGHPCDGLVTAACALSLGLRELYPDGVIDRTDTGGVCNNSPCYGDVVEYLTGGRIRFGTQKIDPSLANEFILYRFSTRQAVQVALKPGVFPIEVSRLETKIRGGDFSVADMRRCQQLEWNYARGLLSRPLAQSFTVSTLTNFDWQPDAYAHLGKRGDIINKDILKNPATPK